MTAGESTPAPVLMLFLEPAPYIVGFVDAVRRAWPGRVDVLYAAARMSQDWDYQPDGDGDVVLPPRRRHALDAIKRRLSSGQYALVHLAGWGHPLLWRAMLYAARRVPVTVQTDTPAPASEPAWKRLAKKIAYGALFRLPAMFVPAGTPQAAYVRSFAVPAARIKIAQLTVDVAAIAAYADRFTAGRREQVRTSWGLPATDIVLLYVGRLEPHKGIDDLLAAFARLRHMRSDVRLVIVGDGSLRDHVVATASTTAAIHYRGRLAGDALWDAYNIADIFILPSLSEPWGLVVNEAMAAGLPVIATDRVGCAADLVRDGATGLVVPAGSPVALHRALADLCADAGLRARMAAAARESISGWTLANQASNTTAAWRQALSP